MRLRVLIPLLGGESVDVNEVRLHNFTLVSEIFMLSLSQLECLWVTAVCGCRVI